MNVKELGLRPRSSFCPCRCLVRIGFLTLLRTAKLIGDYFFNKQCTANSFPYLNMYFSFVMIGEYYSVKIGEYVGLPYTVNQSRGRIALRCKPKS
jgi:hypothetical protein